MVETNNFRHLATVFMSDTNKQFIENIIKTVRAALQKQAATLKNHKPSTNTTTNNEEENISKDMPQSKEMMGVCNKLQEMGFQPADAKKGAAEAAKHITTDRIGRKKAPLNVAMDWLFMNVPEHRLPKSMNTSSTLQVVSNQSLGGELSKFLGHGRMGFPGRVCADAWKDAGENLDPALLRLFRDLHEDLLTTNKISIGQNAVDAEAVQEEIDEEIMALEAIFESDFTRLSPTSWKVNMGRKLGKLEVVVPAGCNYPHELPVWIIRHKDLSAYQRLYIVRSCAKYCVQDEGLLGSALTFAVVDWLKNNTETILSSHEEFGIPRSWRGAEGGGAYLSEDSKKSLVQTQTQAISYESTADAKTAEVQNQDGRKGRGRGPLKNDPATNAKLLDAYNTKLNSDSTLKNMLKQRERLPAWKAKQKLMDLIDNNQVVVVSGETGCGKSTQIPQFVLDHLIQASKGSLCNVICTQPRRISAVGLAERVAEERAEKCGETVGYRIRLETKASPETRLFYVTTGILLRQLAANSSLEGVSHIIIDEVHERSMDIDFLLIILKKTIQRRPDLKVVLMSATLDAERFSAYFGNCPTISIPGRTFPVQDHFLEDILEEMKYVPPKSGFKGMKEEDRIAAIEKVHSKLDGSYSEGTIEALAAIDGKRIDYDLCSAVIWHIIQNYPEGGILVFMPGVAEISKLCRIVEQDAAKHGLDKNDLWLVPLHGSLSTTNQQRVFARAPRGVKKVVVSTNIAETSITVTDVLYVIDTGKVKEVQYAPEKKMSMLVETWASQANMTQRKGRAGRVQNGHGFKLFSSLKFNSLPKHQLPEIHRTCLDHVCLQIKLLGLDNVYSANGIASVMQEALEPPPAETITSAIDTLSLLGALDDSQKLTPLGHHLARLPVGNVRIGKLLLYGAMFACLRPVVCIAALMSCQSPFVAPLDKRDEARECKMKYAQGKSDHITWLNHFEAWLQESKQGYRNGREFAEANFMKQSILEMVKGTCDQFLDALADIGFIPKVGWGNGSKLDKISDELNSNTDNLKVLTAVLCAGLFPNVIQVKHPEEVYTKMIHGAGRTFNAKRTTSASILYSLWS